MARRPRSLEHRIPWRRFVATVHPASGRPFTTTVEGRSASEAETRAAAHYGARVVVRAELPIR